MFKHIINQTEKLPWLFLPRQIILDRFFTQKLPAAMLLSGPKGIGKYQLAFELTSILLCSNSSPEGPCNQCQSCLLLSHQTHPDLLLIAPIKAHGAISIEQSRDILLFVENSPRISARRLIIIHQADRLNVPASNALLKILEESPINTYFLLTTNNPGLLLTTVKSRLFEISCQTPTAKEMSIWLKLDSINNQKNYQTWLAVSPLLIYQILKKEGSLLTIISQDLYGVLVNNASLIQIVERWQTYVFEEILDWWKIIIYCLVRQNNFTEKLPDIASIKMQYIYNLAEIIDINKLWIFSEILQEKTQILSGQRKLNVQLMLESLLIFWLTVVRC